MDVSSSEQFQYSPEQKKIILPSTAQLIDTQDFGALWGIPKTALKLEEQATNEYYSDTYKYTLDELFPGAKNPTVSAIADSQGRVRIIIPSDGAISSLDEIKQRLDASIHAPEKDNYDRCPALLDHTTDTLVIPIDSNISHELGDIMTTSEYGVLDNHDRLMKLTRFFNALTSGKKNPDAVEMTMDQVTYLDLSRTASNVPFINANGQRLNPEILTFLNTFGITTADKLPFFKGKGSLEELATSLGFNLEYDSSLREIVLKSLTSRITMERNTKNHSLRQLYILGKRDERYENADMIARTYNHEIGIPLAGILTDRGTIYFSKTHPEILDYIGPSAAQARFDGVFRLRVPHGSTNNSELLNFTFHCQRTTLPDGSPVLDQRQKLKLSTQLHTLEREIQQALAEREDGLDIVFEPNMFNYNLKV